MLEIQTPVSESGYILVIDDDPAVSGLYLKYLAPLGLIIESSIGAKEAWTLLRERIPLLVLLDVLMPDTDGWDILQQLRSDQATRDVPVIVCSVLADPNMAIAMGATAVLSKPIDPMDMFAQVSQILRLEGSAGAPSS